jgi:hypothetical protein
MSGLVPQLQVVCDAAAWYGEDGRKLNRHVLVEQGIYAYTISAHFNRLLGKVPETHVSHVKLPHAT